MFVIFLTIQYSTLYSFSSCSPAGCSSWNSCVWANNFFLLGRRMPSGNRTRSCLTVDRRTSHWATPHFFSGFCRDSSAAFSLGYSSTNCGVDPVGLFIHLGWPNFGGAEPGIQPRTTLYVAARRFIHWTSLTPTGPRLIHQLDHASPQLDPPHLYWCMPHPSWTMLHPYWSTPHP